MTKNANLLLRALATCAVITLHVLAMLPPEVYRATQLRPFAVGIDQLCRISVPLFVCLSGYGFWKKYQKNTFVYSDFLLKQSKKLLPLYLLASLLFYAVFKIVPLWRPSWHVPSLPVQILTGQADYHLYFVPMIFQFYMLFPLFLFALKKAPRATITLTVIWQIGLYALFSSLSPNAFIATYFSTDLMQYLWFFSWIFYFALGMYLDTVITWVKTSRLKVVAVAVLSCAGWYWAYAQSMSALKLGIDPIIALRFTRIPVLFYATTSAVLLILAAQYFTQKKLPALQPLLSFGKHSYVIYLFHTLVLRTIFTLLR